MKRLLLLASLALLAGCPKEKEPETFDPGPPPARREATPVPLAGVIPGNPDGPQHICWRNPTMSYDGYPLVGEDAKTHLQSVIVSWSQEPLPADCETREDESSGFDACPGWEAGNMFIGTSVPGAEKCTDINLPSGINYVAAVSEGDNRKESGWSNVNTYDTPMPKAPPEPPGVLDPICRVAPKCMRWIGQTLHGYIDTPIVLRWRPSNQFKLNVEVLTWPAGTSVKNVTLVVGDGTFRWIPTAIGQYSSRARMCNAQSQCSAWVSSTEPQQWVYDIVDPPNVPGPTDDEDQDPQPVADTRAAPEPPIPDTPLCRVEPICELYSGDTVFAYVTVPISLSQKAVPYYTFGQMYRERTGLVVATRILPPDTASVRWIPNTQGRFFSRSRHCTTNSQDNGQCSEWVGSSTPPTHWQYVIGPLPAGTVVEEDTFPEPTMDPVEEVEEEGI